MREPWQQLLDRLNVTDQDILDVVANVCRRKFSFDRQKVTEELIFSVRNMVVLSLGQKLLQETGLPYFHDKMLFLGAVRTAAKNSYGADTWPRYRGDRAVKKTQNVSPEALREVEERPDRYGDERELLHVLTDCDRATGKCLGAASDKQRQVFLLICRGYQRHGQRPPNAELQLQMKGDPSTFWRHWKEATRMFALTCGNGIPDA